MTASGGDNLKVVSKPRTSGALEHYHRPKWSRNETIVFLKLDLDRKFARGLGLRDLNSDGRFRTASRLDFAEVKDMPTEERVFTLRLTLEPIQWAFPDILHRHEKVQLVSSPHFQRMDRDVRLRLRWRK